jgi:uncharacterized protein involved in exopolysaccharide biosynthesis
VNNNLINTSENEISLKQFLYLASQKFHIIKKNKKSVFIAIFLFCSLGIILSKVIKPKYVAILTFALEEEGNSGGGLGSAAGIASQFGIDIGGGASGAGMFSSSNIIELMKSENVIEKTLLSPIVIKSDTISLIDYYLIISGTKKSWVNDLLLQKISFPINYKREDFSFAQDSILKVVSKTLSSNKFLDIQQKDKKVSITTITFKYYNNQFAKKFAENLAKITSDFYIENKSKKARINVEILQKQVDSIKNELRNSIYKSGSTADNVFNLNPAMNSRRSLTLNSQLNTQSNSIIMTQLSTNLELAKINLRKETPLIQVIDSPRFPLPIEKVETSFAAIIGILFGTLVSIIFILIKDLLKN